MPKPKQNFNNKNNVGEIYSNMRPNQNRPLSRSKSNTSFASDNE